MGKKMRPFEFYGFDCDSTMEKRNEREKDEVFQISKVIEQKNEKFIKE